MTELVFISFHNMSPSEELAMRTDTAVRATLVPLGCALPSESQSSRTTVPLLKILTGAFDIHWRVAYDIRKLTDI